MGKKITGGSLSLSAGVIGLTVDFERDGTDDAGTARRVLLFPEDRRILLLSDTLGGDLQGRPRRRR